jgi:hypothetical protein
MSHLHQLFSHRLLIANLLFLDLPASAVQTSAMLAVGHALLQLAAAVTNMQAILFSHVDGMLNHKAPHTHTHTAKALCHGLQMAGCPINTNSIC